MSVPLGIAGHFCVLSATGIINNGPTTVTGDFGEYPGNVFTSTGGFTITGNQHFGDATAQQAQLDLTTAYNISKALVPTKNLTGFDLAALPPLTPGVYKYNGSATLTGIMNLVGSGN